MERPGDPADRLLCFRDGRHDPGEHPTQKTQAERGLAARDPRAEGRGFEQELGGRPAPLRPCSSLASAHAGLAGPGGPHGPASGPADAEALQARCPTFPGPARDHQMQSPAPSVQPLSPRPGPWAAPSQMASRQAGCSPPCPGLLGPSQEPEPYAKLCKQTGTQRGPAPRRGRTCPLRWGLSEL